MANPYTEVAEKYQVELDYKQFIRVETVAAKEFRQQRINPLDYTAIIFTSRTAILHFFTLMKEMRISIPDTMKYYCCLLYTSVRLDDEVYAYEAVAV